MISYILVLHVIHLFKRLVHNFKIELIQNFPCNDPYSSKCKETEIIKQMIQNIKINEIK